MADSIYEAVATLYDRETAWQEMLQCGSPESLNLAEEAIEANRDRTNPALKIRDLDAGTTESYSYRELDDAANQVANYVENRTDPTDRVAGMLPVSVESHAVLYGTLKAGRPFVPISTEIGPAGKTYRLDDSGTSLAFTTVGNLADLDLGELPSLSSVVVTDESAPDAGGADVSIEAYDAVEARADDFETQRLHPNDVYAIKYTSGTTGDPKGCLPTHGSLLPNLHAYMKYAVDLEAGDVYFTESTPTTRPPFMIGAHVFGVTIAQTRGEFDAAGIAGAIENFGVNILKLAPSTFRQLRAAEVALSPYDIDVRVLITGGESLDEATIEWSREALGAPPQEAYGTSETSMVLSNYPFEDWEIKPGSLGKPLPGLDVAVVDDDGAPVEAGETGELVIERSRTERGWYWGKPEQAIDEFRGRWHRTGDLVRRDEDGYVWYITRKSAAIRVDGHLIGPGQVEGPLLGHDAVEEVGIVESEAGGIRAVVSLSSGASPSDGLREDIFAYAEDALAAHERPDEIEFVDDLPKTATGKIRRTAL